MLKAKQEKRDSILHVRIPKKLHKKLKKLAKIMSRTKTDLVVNTLEEKIEAVELAYAEQGL